MEATVTKVTDGDTVGVTIPGGSVEKVRLISVDTPEAVHPEKGRGFTAGKPPTTPRRSCPAAGSSLRSTLRSETGMGAFSGTPAC